MSAAFRELELCDWHYAVVIDGLTVLGEQSVLKCLELMLGIPPGGLAGVLILRAEAPPRYEGGQRRWVQLRACRLCGAGAGEGPPSPN